MPTWEWILVIILVLKLILIVVTLISPPPFIKEWLKSKFELHPVLDEEAVIVTRDDNGLEGKDKKQVIDFFNQAHFLKKYDWLPVRGEITPLIIETKKSKKQIKYCLYIYENRVDVFREYKKKVVAYYISSEKLPEYMALAN